MRAAIIATAGLLILAGLGFYWTASQLRPTPVHADDTGSGVTAAILSADTWDRFTPRGKEVDAIFGDIVLENEHLTAVIAQPTASRNANMTVRDVAGGLIDFTANVDMFGAPSQSDQLSAFYPGQRAFPYRSWTVNDADGTELDLSNSPFQGDQVSVTVHAEGADGRLQVDTTYTLSGGSRWLTVTSVFTNTTDAPIDAVLSDDIRCDGRKEEMVKSENGEGDFYFIADQFWGQAYAVTTSDHTMQFNSDANRSDIKYLDQGGTGTFAVQPGESITLTRELTAGPTQLHVAEAYALRGGAAISPVQVNLHDGAFNSLNGAEVTIRPLNEANSHFTGVVRTQNVGVAYVPLAAGDYELDFKLNGQTLMEGKKLEISGIHEHVPMFIVNPPGFLQVTVTDGDGIAIPCKVEITGIGDTPTPHFGPETAEYGVRNLRYDAHGQFTQALARGDYSLIVSHGPEYDAVFAEVAILPAATTEWSCQLVRSVDTTGWISSDFHSHASPSGDNTTSQLGRVLNLVCEHLEFAPCTEHNRIDSYQPHIDALQIGDIFASCSGIELTGSPLPVNHQNAFPLEHHHHHQDGGAPLTDMDPAAQVARLALWDNRSEKLVQQNHPDLGWLLYDRDGDGQHDEGHDVLPHLDVIEVHPVQHALDLQPLVGDYNNTMFNWLQMINQGQRFPGVINTDAHYTFHGSGWARNWIRCPTDDPAEIDVLDIVHAAEQGRLVMSNGPFLEVTASLPNGGDTFEVGDTVVALDRQVTIDVKVQCANWLDVNRVFVLVNGRRSTEHDYSRETHPDMFGDGVVKFDHELTLTVEADAHIIIVTGGEGLTLGPVMGPDNGVVPPAAVTNPIWIDVDGDGWTPSMDTLDAPLPVRRS